MITGELRSKIDRLWDAFWSGGISNPLEVIEQITYLMFIKRLDDLQTLKENKANRTGKPIENPVYTQNDPLELRWSVFTEMSPEDMYQVVAVFPVTEDEDVAVIDGEDGRAQFGPASWVLAGPWCAWWRGGGQSVVISVMAARALCSSTMFLRAAQAATRAWVARLLTARGRPRAASWMRVMASSLNRVSDRPASLR